jgi:hypothetical protein
LAGTGRVEKTRQNERVEPGSDLKALAPILTPNDSNIAAANCRLSEVRSPC